MRPKLLDKMSQQSLFGMPSKNATLRKLVDDFYKDVYLPAERQLTQSSARCRVCGRPLSTPTSVEAGAGAICLSRERDEKTLPLFESPDPVVELGHEAGD